MTLIDGEGNASLAFVKLLAPNVALGLLDENDAYGLMLLTRVSFSFRILIGCYALIIEFNYLLFRIYDILSVAKL